MHNGIAAAVLALTILGAAFGTIARVDAATGEAEHVGRVTLERILAKVERGLRQMAGAPPSR